jgi:hypothetical protein
LIASGSNEEFVNVGVLDMRRPHSTIRRYAHGGIQYVIAFNIITTTNTAVKASPKI